MPDSKGTTAVRTGLFGGSFNPVHNGHIAIAGELLRASLLDEVWFVVSPQNPLKRRFSLVDDMTRLEMVLLALRDEPQMQASDFEFHLPRPSYMWNTLRQMSLRWPKRDFRLIIGADNWLCFDSWFAHDEILAHYPIIIYPRPGSPVDVAQLPSNVTLVNTPMNDISSTLVRQRISHGEPIGGLLPPQVEVFIRENKLYR